MAKSDIKGRSKASAKVIPYQDPHAVRDVRVNNLEMAIGHEVRTLRKKLGDPGVIETVVGAGYRVPAAG